MSSRARTVHEGGLFVLKNQHGYYAITKLLDVDYENTNGSIINVSLQYKIIPKKLLATWRADKSVYVSTATEGRISDFDFTNNNGVFSIGEGKYLFNTKWSNCSSTCVYLYNDLQLQISLATNVTEISQIQDVEGYQKAQRTIRVPLKGVAILKNKQGRYAIIKIISVKSEETSKTLTFDYLILPE
jgi:hypothetical protein